MAVTGIGGVFFRAKDPGALLQWYRVHLGVVLEGYAPWPQQAGPTVIMPFASNSEYWPHTHEWMINFRVTDLDGLMTQLKAAGIAVTTNPAWDSPQTGRFARIYDLEGNPVELWEPAAK
jgi:predicted enzyme related to lactoylglutathione lyase